ncbi:MAG TPA: type II toxin-antitoxin system HicB family antitoxin [Myxococcales bacterium]|nr:type II toxin-antitoxin system HicB family antitoxin [Myxococcales bacterium]
MTLHVELEREEDGRWLADVVDLPGTMAYGATRDDALTAVEALAFRVIADRVEQRELPRPDMVEFSYSS